MIQPNELRIGNYITDTHSTIKTPFSVISLGKSRVYYRGCQEFWSKYENIEPIPLTEEWLLKLGFSDKDYKPGYIGIDVRYTDFVLDKPCESHEEYAFLFDFGGWPRIKRFDYVHELQNWFFALFDEELTIKTLEPNTLKENCYE